MTFGMAITIPEEEMDLCRRLSRPAWVVAGLQNDLFSWQKEYETSVRNDQSHVVNAIWVLMEEYSITVEEAKELCRLNIKEHVAQFVHNVEEARVNLSYSTELRRYLEAILYSISGNGVWSLYCPRYHPEASFNERQLSRMKISVGNAPATRQNGYDNVAEVIAQNSGIMKPFILSNNHPIAPSLPGLRAATDHPLMREINEAVGENCDEEKVHSNTLTNNHEGGKVEKLHIECSSSFLGLDVRRCSHQCPDFY